MVATLVVVLGRAGLQPLKLCHDSQPLVVVLGRAGLQPFEIVLCGT